MPIITISRGSYYHGKAVAEQLAEKLCYSCLSRDIIIDSLEEFHLPEIKLVRNINDAFSVLERFPHGKQRFKTAIRSAILQKLLPGNVVYHGLFGHHFLNNISHVLKLRIIADTDSRVADDMRRENISEEQARYILKKDDEERRKWGMFLYGIDIIDPEKYHMVINIGDLNEDEAVDIIASTVQLPSFAETDKSRRVLADLALEALVCTKLFDYPNASVFTRDGQVEISIKAPEGQQTLIKGRIDEMMAHITDLKSYELRFEPYF